MGSSKEASDPFDLDALRATAMPEVDVARVTLKVPVRRPKREEFFRVHPDPDYSIDWWVIEWDGPDGRETYWITRELYAEYAKDCRTVRIFTCINKHGTVFLWPAKLPTDNQGARGWAESGLQVADLAVQLWVKMFGNRNLGAYEMVKAQGDLGEPVWPDKPFKDLLKRAFDGALIDRPDHPVLKEINGEM